LNPPEPPTVFDEPWQAQAFALTVHLHAKGAFSWAQWASALSEVIARGASRGEPADGSHYYHHWLEALEALTTRQGLTNAASLDQRKADWVRAYQETPHGQPVELNAAPS
jgi:nitrile hydratase accessory protein